MTIPPHGSLDRITGLAARLFDTPIAIVAIVDGDGLHATSAHGLAGVEVGPDPGTVADPLVAAELGLRFHAAAPLRDADGNTLGTLCVIDREPRSFGDHDHRVLEDLAAIVVDQLELRRAARGLDVAAAERLRLLEERQRQAMQLNDDALQRLAVAQMSLHVGADVDLATQVGGALEAVKVVLTEMAADAISFRRDAPAASGQV